MWSEKVGRDVEREGWDEEREVRAEEGVMASEKGHLTMAVWDGRGVEVNMLRPYSSVFFG